MPYYWNIAPNRDATLFPALLSKRGVDLAGEFRPRAGLHRAAARQLAGDKLRGADRWGWPTPRHAVPARWGRLATWVNRCRQPGERRQLLARLHARQPALTQRLLANDVSFAGRVGLSVSQPAHAEVAERCRTRRRPSCRRTTGMPQLIGAAYTRNGRGGFDLFRRRRHHTQFASTAASPAAERASQLSCWRREPPWIAGRFFTPRCSCTRPATSSTRRWPMGGRRPRARCRP